ncbi:hypothetical protein OGAPHI_002810 [Ogataea philodendri]|uniref:Uncharacterized protein n=1 Tax=Ogataea philodendri TaxID=1378263 RepID=A0A9P8T6Q7_9ASCO|nr:uncharacterized protein OGAPHI_002810 [Ogataea philodendri]KAH3667161.1 hypothetical protein OGAPHI_002810 [Ogataea philodendri]
MENKTPPIGEANATATPAADPAVRNWESDDPEDITKGNAIDLIIRVHHPRNPSITNPETMHLTSEIPDPAAEGAYARQRRAAIIEVCFAIPCLEVSKPFSKDVDSGRYKPDTDAHDGQNYPALYGNHEFGGESFQSVLERAMVQWSRSLSNSTRNVVVGTVTWAEPSPKVSGLTNRNATQVGTDTQHDQPLWVLDSVGILLRVSKRRDIHLVGLGNLGLCSVSDENWLTLPFHNNVLSLRNGTQLHLHLGHGQHICGSSHGGQEGLNGRLGGSSRNQSVRAHHEVGVNSRFVIGFFGFVEVVGEIRRIVGGLQSGLCGRQSSNLGGQSHVSLEASSKRSGQH